MSGGTAGCAADGASCRPRRPRVTNCHSAGDWLMHRIPFPGSLAHTPAANTLTDRPDSVKQDCKTPARAVPACTLHQRSRTQQAAPCSPLSAAREESRWSRCNQRTARRDGSEWLRCSRMPGRHVAPQLVLKSLIPPCRVSSLSQAHVLMHQSDKVPRASENP